jgi:hypothetical protein
MVDKLKRLCKMSDLLLREYEGLSDKEKDDFMEYVNSISLRNKVLNGGMGQQHLAGGSQIMQAPPLTTKIPPFQLGDQFPYPDSNPKKWELIDVQITEATSSLDGKYRRRWVGGKYVDERI